jgi:hypothetical protein
MRESEIQERASSSLQGFQRSKFMRVLGTGSAVVELAITVVLMLFGLLMSINGQWGGGASAVHSLLAKSVVLSLVALFILDFDGGVDHTTMALAGIGLFVQRFCFYYYFSTAPTVWMTVWWIAVAFEAIAMARIAVLYFRQGGYDDDRPARTLFFFKKVLFGLIIFIIVGLLVRRSNNDIDDDIDD